MRSDGAHAAFTVEKQLGLRDEQIVVALLNPNRIGHGFHAYNLTTLAPVGKPNHRLGGLIPGFEHLVVRQKDSQLLIVAGHRLVCGFQAVEASEPLCGVALLLVEGFADAFAIGKIAMPPAERVEVAALEAAWRARVGVRGRVEEHGEEGVLYPSL